MSRSLTSIATDAVTAVTDSITSYFKKKERFNQEFFIPAAAFVVGCLAVVMAILGPGVPRAWWGKLTGDLKLLVVALLIVALILITELSKPLALLVRQLYSGEWPAWSWLQWRRKLPILREQVRWQKTAPDLFEQADTIFNRMTSQFDAWKTAAKPPATGKADYPVLSRPVGAYHLISESDWCWASAQQTAGAIATPADLLGRYTLKPLKAGVPVRPEEVSTLPDKRFLKSDRQILTVEFFPGDLAAQITRGLIATLYVRPRAENAKPVNFRDLFVLERSDDRLVLSIPQDHVSRLVALLPGGRLTLTHDASADLRPLQAVPVVRATNTEGQPTVIHRGQLIQGEQITWAVKKAADLPELGDIFTAEADIVGKIYWPPAASPDLTLIGGQPFRQQDLVPVPAGAKAEWFTFQDANGADRSRLAYRIDLSQAATTQGHGQRYVETDVATGSSAEDLTINLLAIDFSLTEQARPQNTPADVNGIDQLHPVGKGDRVEVAFYKANASEPFDREPLCYVHDLKAGDYAWLSVRDPETFNGHLQQAQQGGKITLNPYVGLPVLTRSLARGDLIEPGMVTTRYFLAKDSALIDGMHTSATDVEYCCVVAKGIKQGSPIPRAAVQKAWLDKREWLKLSGEAGRFTLMDREGSEPGGGLETIKPGDLIEVTLRRETGETLPWKLSFVRTVTVKKDQPVCIELAVPSQLKHQAESLWAQKGTTAKLTVTHTDNYVRKDLADLEKEIKAKDRLAPISKILSASDGREQALVKEARGLEQLLDRLVAFRKQLDERHWRRTPLTDPNEDGEAAFWRLQEQLRDIVERWQQVRQALEERRERESARMLPDEAAEVRSTRVGKVLAAAADYPEQVYHIDTATILPRLLNVLRLEPEEGTVKDSVLLRLINTEASLNMMLLFSFWAAVWAVLSSVALLAFGGPWWMFLVVAVGGALLAWVAQDTAYYQAVAYGEALKALFDLRRHKLLEAIGYQLSYPISPVEERMHWRNLNSLYALGVAEDFPKLKKPGDQGKGG